jgi:hypothetical protein
MAAETRGGGLIEGGENTEQFPHTTDTVVESYINRKQLEQITRAFRLSSS